MNVTTGGDPIMRSYHAAEPNISAALAAANTGNMKPLALLTEEVLYRDMFVSALWKARAHRLSVARWRLVAADGPHGELVCDWINEALYRGGCRVNGLIFDLGTAPAIGYAACEIEWKALRSGALAPRDAHRIGSRFINFNPVTDEPLLVVDGMHGQPLPPNKFVFHRAPGNSPVTACRGWMRAVLDDAMELQRLWGAITSELGSGKAAILPLGASFSGCATEEAAQRQRAMAEIHERIVHAACCNMHLDAEAVATTLREQLLAPIVEVNRERIAEGIGATPDEVAKAVPWIEIQTEQRSDDDDLMNEKLLAASLAR